MLAGEFQRKIRQLNRNLRIWCGDTNHLPAGLFHVARGQYEQICGVDKNYVPEHTELAENGAIIRSGWRRTLRVLIKQRLINRRDAERVFGCNLPYGVRRPIRPAYKPKNDLIRKYSV